MPRFIKWVLITSLALWLSSIQTMAISADQQQNLQTGLFGLAGMGGFEQAPSAYSSANVSPQTAIKMNTQVPQQTGYTAPSSLQNQAPAPAPSGGGGNNYQSQWQAAGHPGTAPVGYHGESAQGPDQAAIDAAISDTYNASNNYLNQAEQQVNADYPTVQQDIQGQYDTSKGQLDTSHTSNVNQLNQQTGQADYGHETALAAARRLYSELRQGYQQRFGGSSSAGDAANQLANVEQQRQEGQQNHSYQDTLTTINNHKTDVENQYQTGLQTLVSQKNTALNQANRDFQNKLLQISQSRAANEQAKGQARLQALQDLRNQVFQINQQNTQFQQTLEAQRQQAGLQLQNYEALAGQGVNNSGQAAAAYGMQAAQRPTSTLQAGGASAQGQQQYTGAVTGGIKYDQYGNPISG